MTSSRGLDLELVARSMNFHGQPFQKVWETEREADLQKLAMDNIDFSVYSQRQLNFQDRGKRLKLHQFIANKADTLFDPALNEREERPVVRVSEPGLYAILPPYDTFLNVDKSSRVKHFFQCVKPGDVVIGTIASKPPAGLVVKVLCVEGEAFRYVADLNIKALCPSHSTIQAVDKKNVSRSFLINDLVCCEVIEVHEESEKLVCGMKGVHAAEHRARLGLFLAEDFPEAYKQAQEGNNGETYSEMLEKAVGFNNPNNINCLSNALGLGMNNFSCMSALREKFPEGEFASELRQVQASRWAHRSVADGIEHFKAKRHGDAFQCLNRALNIDPRNIEGLVARGALHANSCSFKKAIEDFETALKLNPNHQNARKYLGETLVAYGRSFEEENKMDEAIKAYESCLAILPYHEEAQNSIDYIKNKKANGTSKLLAAADVSSIAGLTLNKAQGVKDTLKQLLGESAAAGNHLKDDGHSSAADKAGSSANSAKKKKKDKKRRRHRRSSSTSSSSSSASSSSSSSSSSSDSSSASSQDSHHKKKHKRKDKERDRDRERSLSPLSKRMAMMDSGLDNEGLSGSAMRVHYNPPAMPNTFTTLQAAQQVMEVNEKSDKESEYEQRVRKFLAQTKGDSDYEEKVRKFLDETAKWKKEKKAIEEKSKKKKKKEKKAKNKSKKKKREEKRKKKALKELEEKKLREALKRGRRRRSSASLRAGADEEDDDEDSFVFGEKPDQAIRMLSMGNIRELEDLQSKLSAYYAKVEKESASPPPPPLKKKDLSAEKSIGLAKNKISPKMMYEDQDEPKEDDSPPPPPPLPSRNLTSSLLVKKRLELLNASATGESPLPHIAAAPKEAAPVTPQRLADIMPPKFKMQIGNVGNRLKGKKIEDQSSRDMWEDDRERNERELTRFVFVKDGDADERGGGGVGGGGDEDGSDAKKSPEVKKKDEEGSGVGAGENSFRLSRSPDVKPQKRKLRARTSDSESSDSGARRGGDDSSQSRSRSRSRKKYSSESPKKYSSESRSSSYHRKERSRSKSGSYRSRSRRYRSSESGSYRSRSYSRSRSRSRSGDYRRSRSRSDDRYHYRKYVGRYPRNRGTYYRPRFQNYKSPRGGGGGYGGGGGGQRGHRNRGYGNRGGNRGYGAPRMRGRGRPRFFHHKYGERRDYRRYDRGGSRSDEDDLSPMRKVESAKERIDKMLGAEEKRHSGPLSEGEERDDDFIDRKDYDGKWAKEPEGPRLPPHQ